MIVRIGNAMPSDAAKPITDVMGRTLLLAAWKLLKVSAACTDRPVCIMETAHGCGSSASGSAGYDAPAAIGSSPVAGGRCAFHITNAALPESESP